MKGRRPSSLDRALRPATTYLLSTPILDVPAEVGLDAGHRVLDLSPDVGQLASVLAGRIDLQHAPVAVAGSIAVARRIVADQRAMVQVVGGGLHRLPFADYSFHLIMAAYLFRSMDNDALFRVLLEAKRVLKPGGIVLAWEFAPTGSARLDGFHSRLLTRDGSACHLRSFVDLAPLALYAGFKHVDRKQFKLPFLLPPIPRVAVMLQTARDE